MEFGAVTGTLKVFSTASDVPGFQVTLLPVSSHNSVPSNTETHSIVGEKTPPQKTKAPKPKSPKSFVALENLWVEGRDWVPSGRFGRVMEVAGVPQGWCPCPQVSYCLWAATSLALIGMAA